MGLGRLEIRPLRPGKLSWPRPPNPVKTTSQNPLRGASDVLADNNEEAATGRVAEIYEAQKSQMGFIMSTAKSFTPRPDLLPIYTDFIDKVRAGFSLGCANGA